jgi:hypothetical protein
MSSLTVVTMGSTKMTALAGVKDKKLIPVAPITDNAILVAIVVMFSPVYKDSKNVMVCE